MRWAATPDRMSQLWRDENPSIFEVYGMAMRMDFEERMRVGNCYPEGYTNQGDTEIRWHPPSQEYLSIFGHLLFTSRVLLILLQLLLSTWPKSEVPQGSKSVPCVKKIGSPSDIEHRRVIAQVVEGMVVRTADGDADAEWGNYNQKDHCNFFCNYDICAMNSIFIDNAHRGVETSEYMKKVETDMCPVSGPDGGGMFITDKPGNPRDPHAIGIDRPGDCNWHHWQHAPSQQVSLTGQQVSLTGQQLVRSGSSANTRLEQTGAKRPAEETEDLSTPQKEARLMNDLNDRMQVVESPNVYLKDLNDVDFFNKMRGTHMATRVPIEVSLSSIVQAEFGTDGFASRPLNEAYYTKIAEDIWSRGIIFLDILECYLEPIEGDARTSKVEAFNEAVLQAAGVIIRVFCHQHLCAALKLCSEWFTKQKEGGRLVRESISKVRVNIWVGLSQIHAIRVGHLHNDITHEFIARDFFSTLCSLRTRWQCLGSVQAPMKDGKQNALDGAYQKIKKACFLAMNIENQKDIDKFRFLWKCATFPEDVFDKIVAVYKAYQAGKVLGQTQRSEAKPKAKPKKDQDPVADKSLVINEMKGGAKQDTLPQSFYETLLFLNSGNPNDYNFAKAQLDLVIEAQMSLASFCQRVRDYMKRKGLQVQLCFLLSIPREGGWAKLCTDHLKCNVDQSYQKIKPLLDALPDLKGSQNDTKGWVNKDGQPHELIQNFVDELNASALISRRADTNDETVNP